MHQIRLSNLAQVLAGAVLLSVLPGCGGGGGGATPATIRGRVLLVGTGTAPNPAATVTVQGASSVTTAADGTFTVASAPSTATTITITATGSAKLVQALPTLKANAVNNIGDVFLSDTGYTAEVTARVVRSDTLAVIPGASVLLSGRATTTAADGTFSITGLPVGLGTTPVDAGVIKVTGLEDKAIRIDLPLGASPPINDLGDIQVSPPVGPIPGGPYNIRGTVSLTGTTDFSNTTVSLRSAGGVVLDEMTTGTDGSYGFWMPAATYTVAVSHAGYTGQSKTVILTRPDVPVTAGFTLSP